MAAKAKKAATPPAAPAAEDPPFMDGVAHALDPRPDKDYSIWTAPLPLLVVVVWLLVTVLYLTGVVTIEGPLVPIYSGLAGLGTYLVRSQFT